MQCCAHALEMVGIWLYAPHFGISGCIIQQYKHVGCNLAKDAMHATGSQVCNLSWSKNVNEIVSTHGYSQNQIIVWRHPTMTKLATLTGHTMRVLYLATSPDGQTIVTGAGVGLALNYLLHTCLTHRHPAQ